MTDNDNDQSAIPSSNSLLPKVLTRDDLPSLIQKLDASDVLECYSLIRNAELDGFQNATIQKIAIGFRYDPPAKSNKPPLELTLEYGPQRVGETFDRESTPSLLAGQNHISWVNKGYIYYTTSSIQSLQWKSAYYMASLTGTVLGKLLEKAVSYPFIKPHYQPFSVVFEDKASPHSNNNNEAKVLLKSSSSSDFVHQMWSDMVNMGVDMRPILIPKTYRAQLFTSEKKIEKVSGYDDDGLLITDEAASFYRNFLGCLTAIATADYSPYEPAFPSASPTETMPSASPSETVVQILSPSEKISFEDSQGEGVLDKTIKDGTESTNESDEYDKDYLEQDENYSEVFPIENDTNDEDEDLGNDFYYVSGGKFDNKSEAANDEGETSTNLEDDDIISEEENNELIREGENQSFDSDSDQKLNNTQESNNTTSSSDYNDNNRNFLLRNLRRLTNTRPRRDELESRDILTDDIYMKELAQLNDTTNSQPYGNDLPSESPSLSHYFPGSDSATEAHKAAQEAKEAAQQAKNASSHAAAEKAADAAEHAADAAKKAADVAKWTNDMEKLLSGDGDLVSQSLQECWTDPRFGLTDENNTDVIAYLYLDGNSFFRFPLTPPYFQIVPDPTPFPKIPSDTNITPDDFVDWTLAFLIMGFAITGVCMLIQQGSGIEIVCYKKLKYFFNPTGQDYEGEKDHIFLNSKKRSKNGAGQVHMFSQDAIPTCMGGNRPGKSRISELVITSSPKSTSRKIAAQRNREAGTVELVRFRDDPLDEESNSIGKSNVSSSQRLSRNHDYVDMPNLKSRSRVARPVTSQSFPES